MAIEYVSELGDKLSNNNTAANLPKHIKVISAPNYQRTDNGVVTNPSLQTALDGKAPTAHASTATTYGVGSSTKYGHVKLYDNVTGSNTDGAPTQKAVKEAIAASEGGKVKATAKSDNVNYKLLATASASPTSGALTEAVYDTDITLNPSTNTLTANLSGTATYAKALDPQIILNSTLYKVPVISADKEVRWSGAPGASGSTTELTYDNSDGKNLLSVNISGNATGLNPATMSSAVLYKVPLLKGDKTVAWSGAPGASGSTTELSYDNSNGVNLLSVNISGNAATATALNVGAMANTGSFKIACFDDNGVGYWETDATKGRLLFDAATNALGVNITGNAATASTATSATSATTATKLASSAGSTSQPVFINSSGQPQVIPLQKAANNENYLTMQCQSAYYAVTAGTSAACSGNAATATSAASCTGNSLTATTATKLAASAGGPSQPIYINSSGAPTEIALVKKSNNEYYLTMQCEGAYYAATAGSAATAAEATAAAGANLAGAAYKLATARKSYVALGTASTSSTFDWSGDTVLPVDGTLAVGHGGTGKTSVTANNFLVGNGTSALVEKTPAQVRELIGAGTANITWIDSIPSNPVPGMIYAI